MSKTKLYHSAGDDDSGHLIEIRRECRSTIAVAFSCVIVVKRTAREKHGHEVCALRSVPTWMALRRAAISSSDQVSFGGSFEGADGDVSSPTTTEPVAAPAAALLSSVVVSTRRRLSRVFPPPRVSEDEFTALSSSVGTSTST